MHERFRERENEVHMAFWAMDAVRPLGASEWRQFTPKTIRRADAQ